MLRKKSVVTLAILAGLTAPGAVVSAHAKHHCDRGPAEPYSDDDYRDYDRYSRYSDDDGDEAYVRRQPRYERYEPAPYAYAPRAYVEIAPRLPFFGFYFGR
jgi:hypothetical protein